MHNLNAFLRLRILSVLLFFALIGHNISAQTDTSNLSQDSLASELRMVTIEPSNGSWNEGLINDPLALIRGRIPGISLFRNGDDPNQGLTAIIRGPSSFGTGLHPLIIIDGHPGLDLITIDPNDITSIQVVKSVAASARYGARGTGGALIITTKQAEKDGWHPAYRGFFSATSLSRKLPVATAEEFAFYRPNMDLGSKTDWMDEITRTGISQVHNLSLAGKFGQTSLRAALNYRDIQGIGITSGFDQWNGRLAISQKAFKEKLSLDLHIIGNNRSTEFGFVEAYRYARTFNPTAAVRLPQTDPLFDSYGGYNQRLNFDYYNPVALLEQNSNLQKKTSSLAGIDGRYDLTDALSVNLFYSRLVEDTDGGQVYGKDSYWVGADRNGLVRRTEVHNENEVLEARLDFEKEIGKLAVEVSGGYAFQNFLTNGIYTTAGDFTQDDFSYEDVLDANDFHTGMGILDSSTVGHRLRSGVVSGTFEYDDIYGFFGSLRYDSYKGYEEIYPNAIFPGATGYLKLANLLDFSFLSKATIHVGIGETGAVMGASVPAAIPSSYATNLDWERRRGIDVGVDLGFLDGKLFFSAEYYLHKARDFVNIVAVPVPPNPSPFIYVNIEDVVLRNSGLEMSLGGIVEAEVFSWEPVVNVSIYQSGFDTTKIENPQYRFFNGSGEILDFFSSPGEPGLSSDPSVVWLRQGQLGNFWGLTYKGIDGDGNYQFEDLDNDGIAGIDPNGNIDQDDETIIGQALPDFSFGFYNHITLGDLDLSFLLRGDVGHEMVNHYRIFYESQGSRLVDNLVMTDFFDPELRSAPIFHSNHVEDASYVVLDFVNIGYSLSLESFKLRIFLTGENLFMLTEYSGIDPSFRWEENGIGTFLSPGLDRRNNYPASKTVGAGVEISF